MRCLLAAAVLLASVAAAMAQNCGPTNPNCVVPTAPAGTSDSRAASTAFVQAAASRIRLTAPLALYSNYTAGSDTNACTSPAVACKTVQAAFNKVLTNYDTAGQNITINVAVNDATCLAVNTAWVGGGQITILGPGGNGVQPTVGLSPCPVNGVVVASTLPGLLVLQNLLLTSGGGSSIAHNGTGIVQLNNVAFGVAGGGHITAFGGGAKIFCAQPTTLTMTVAAAKWIDVEVGAIFACPNARLVFVGAQAYGVLAFATAGSVVLLNGTTFCTTYSGACTVPTTVTGLRYQATLNSIVDTETANLTKIPGDAPGTLSLGGQYN
jgi:hypothetical protein